MMNKKLKILFIGAQGSGKSTQGKLLSEYLKIPYLSTGDIFREISRENNELGRKVRRILNEGRLVDDKSTCEVVKKKLLEDKYRQRFILDGYPRTVEQIKTFNPGFDLVFYLDVHKKISLERLLKRVREDDTPALIEARLVDYYNQTHPLVEYFKDMDILKQLNGEKNVEQIQQEIRNIVSKVK